jgi:hypothetical protein
LIQRVVIGRGHIIAHGKTKLKRNKGGGNTMATDNEYESIGPQPQGELPITLPEIDPKRIWPDKAAFTKWLAENLQPLSQLVGLELVPRRKSKSGGLWDPKILPDLFLREVKTGNLVVVLNQLACADATHLVDLKLIMAKFRPKVAIWTSPDPTPECVLAVNLDSQYMIRKNTLLVLIKVQVYDNGDGTSMVRLSIAAGPPGWVSRKASWILVGKER